MSRRFLCKRKNNAQRNVCTARCTYICAYKYIGCVLQKVFSLPTVTSTRCSSNGDCTENAECSRPQGFCFCQQGFVFFEDLCLPGEYPRGETTQTINTCLDLGAAKKGVDTQTEAKVFLSAAAKVRLFDQSQRLDAISSLLPHSHALLSLHSNFLQINLDANERAPRICARTLCRRSRLGVVAPQLCNYRPKCSVCAHE